MTPTRERLSWAKLAKSAGALLNQNRLMNSETYESLECAVAKLAHSNVPIFFSYTHSMPESDRWEGFRGLSTSDSANEYPAYSNWSASHNTRQLKIKISFVSDASGSIASLGMVQHLRARALVPKSSVEQIFNSLRNTWKHDTRFESSASKITSHPSYTLIIAIGPAMIPYIANEVRRGARHWYYALRRITGYTLPDSSDLSSSDFHKVWLQWLDENTNRPSKASRSI